MLLNFSVPLYKSDAQGRPAIFGTGFFVKKNGSYFLVSAAHVLDQAIAPGLYFYGSPSKKIKVEGTLVRTSSAEARHNDLADIGVVKLQAGVRPPFPEVSKFAIDYSYLKPSYLPREGRHYIVTGFPATKSQVDRSARTVLVAPYSYRSDSIDEGAYGKLGLCPKSHIVLPLHRMRGRGPDGKIAHFPSPHGMSGAPIFVLYEGSGDSRVFPVVGVGIEYRESKRAMVGTDVLIVMELIEMLS